MRADVCSMVVECLPVGVVLADRCGSIVFSNRAARVLLQRGISTLDGTRFENSLTCPASHRRFKVVNCGAVRSHAVFQTVPTGTLVFICCPPAEAEAMREALSQAYGLTPQERRLAISLYEGQSIAEAARKIGIETSTARTHLKNIFGKTFTDRQAELVLVIASCAVAAAAPPIGGCAVEENVVASKRFSKQLNAAGGPSSRTAQPRKRLA